MSSITPDLLVVAPDEFGATVKTVDGLPIAHFRGSANPRCTREMAIKHAEIFVSAMRLINEANARANDPGASARAALALGDLVRESDKLTRMRATS